ncbi:MAG: hypothetical protein V1768_00575 [Patescibacteria group bacterium]|nr:hypothetical protein [Patescibacteria group bacterium]MBU1160270.1 hypothetical protein [Patescibacteria group bacterium]MBU1684074.1 hypothetical protein [Patescibacteria group bacterium]MBU1778398.1 hypothetical protein [Patescibacteria group bacterium]MBU2474518.1 hypothetical protein [Patescibacteria group bacterium]
MFNFKKQNFYCIILLIIIVFIFSANSILVKADYNFQENSGLNKTGNNTGHKTIILSNKSPAEIAGLAIKIFIALLGIIFLGLMIYGGYIWMTARGNDQDVEKAKNTIVSATIGLIIVLAAYAVTAYIGKKIKF